MPERSDLPQGTLDLLILQVVAAGAIHGYGIAQRLQLISRDVVQVPQGSLYPALHRLENRGLLIADWKMSDTGRESKFYRLTPKGRKQLKEEAASWLRLTEAIGPDSRARRGIAMTWWRRLLRRRALERELDAELRDHIEREVADGVRARRIGSRRAPPDAVDVWRARPGQRGVPRRPSPARPGRFGGRPAICVANPGQGSVVHRRRHPHARPRHGRGEHDLHQHVRQPPARPAVRASQSHRDYEDARWTRPRGAACPTPTSRIGAGTRGCSTGRRPPLRQAPSAWAGTVPLPEQFDGLYVSADTFTVLRVKPVLGRDFSAADDRPGAEAVAIIGSNIWKSRYGASRDVLGRKVSVNGATPATIIGVMPDGFHFVDFTDVWLPLSQMPGSTLQRRDARALFMIGRLPDGIGLDRVRAELSPIAANLAVTYPETNKDVRPLGELALRGVQRRRDMADRLPDLVPLLAAAFVLLIASANLANLLLARAAYRSREIAIRVAIGATRWRIVRQLLIESLLLALGGVGPGRRILMARPDTLDVACRPAAALLAPQDGRPPAGQCLRPSRSLTTGLFGLAPALYASRRGTADGLKEGGRLSAPRRRGAGPTRCSSGSSP